MTDACSDCGAPRMPPYMRCKECHARWQEKALIIAHSDETYCGLDPFTTGENDPMWPKVCKPHDLEAERVIAGEKVDALGMAARHMGRSLRAGLEGAWMLVMAIPYGIIGAVGGLLRHRVIMPKPKQDPPSDEMQ